MAGEPSTQDFPKTLMCGTSPVGCVQYGVQEKHSENFKLDLGMGSPFLNIIPGNSDASFTYWEDSHDHKQGKIRWFLLNMKII